MSRMHPSRRSFLATLGALLAGMSSGVGIGSLTSTRHVVAAQGQTAGNPGIQSEDGVVYHPRQSDVMRGFPPPKERRVNIDNWTESTPNLRWTHLHPYTVFPTAVIDPGRGPVWTLPRRMVDESNLAKLQVLWGGSRENARQIPVLDWLERSEADSFLVLHDGHIVIEHYWGDMTPRTPHQMWSASKSWLATLLAPLLSRDLIDADSPATRYVDELADTGFAGATVRQLLDMTTGIHARCFPSPSELGLGDQPLPAEWSFGSPEFRKAEHEFARFARAVGEFRELPSEAGTGYYDFLTTVEKSREHGEYFYYTDPNPMVLQWILERIMGRGYTDLASGLLQSLGAECHGSVFLDRVGTPIGTIGLSLSARDWARWGQMLCDDGRVGDGRSLPGIGELLEDVRRNRGPERWREETNAWDWCPRQSGYRSQFWLSAPRTGRPAIPHAAGAFGQKCYIDKEQRTVLVKFSSYWDTLPDKLHLQEPPIFDLIAIESFLEQVPKLVA